MMMLSWNFKSFREVKIKQFRHKLKLEREQEGPKPAKQQQYIHEKKVYKFQASQY